MANDGKTMSDLFMSLMQGLDDDDEKNKRGFIPGTSIPMPDPNSLIPPVLDQFQTPPPKVPYQDAGEYMAAYREANKEAIDAIPKKDMLRADGSTKSSQGYLGAFPDKYGKMMTEQTIGVEIDGKEVQMPAIVPTTTPDEIELLGSGNVNWKSPRGQLIQDKAVANYRDRMSKGLNPYYQDGEGDVPSVQEVPKPVEVDTSALEAFRSDLIGKDPSSYIPKPTSAYDPVANREEYAALVAQNTANRAIQQAAYDANKQQRIADADLSGYIPSSIPSAQRMGKELSLQLGVPAKILEEAGKGAGNLALKGVEAIGDPVVRFGQGFMGSEPTGIESGSLGRYYINDPYRPFSDSPSDVPPESDIPVLPDQEVKPVPKDAKGTPVVTAADVDKSASDLGDKAGDVDTAVNASGVKPGGTVVTTTNTETGEENVVVVDEKGDEKPGFLKGLWNGIKDIAKEGFEDPTMRKALFAYTASKVLGYDGVTLAAGVLENEWQKQAAQAKADLELEKAYGKTQAEAIKNQRADPSKVFTVYDSASKTNYTGAPSIDGTLFYPDNPQIFGVEAGKPVSLSVLRTFENGRFKAERGETKDDLQVKFMERSGNKAKAVIAQISKELELDDTMKGTEKANLIEAMNLATDPEIMRESNLVFLSNLHPNLDPNDQQVIQAQNRGITEWLRSIKDGRSVDNKDFSAFLDLQRMKLNLSQDGVPKAFLTIPSDKDAEIGENAFSKIKNGITNSPQAADLNMDFVTVMGKLATIFDKKSANDTIFKKKYQGKSVESLKGSKSEYVSPFLAYAADAFASDNDDIAELMAELKK